MAQKNKRSTTPRKKTTKTTNQKKDFERAPSERDLKYAHSKKQAWAIVMFFLGLLSIALIFIEGENVWLFLHNTMMGLFGICALFVPVLLIYVAVRATLDEQMGKIKHKLWQSLVLISLISGLCQIIIVKDFAGADIFEIIVNLFNNGISLKGGGVISMLLGLPMSLLLGNVGAIIVLILFLLAFILLITGTTLLEAFKTVYKPVRKMEDHYAKVKEEKEQAKAKFNIDVNLGDEKGMPLHPVSSPRAIFDIDGEVVDEKAPSEEKNSPIKAFKKAIGGAKEKQTPQADELVEATKEAPQVQKSEVKADDAHVAMSEELDNLITKALPKQSKKETRENVQQASKEFESVINGAPVAQVQPKYNYPPISLLKAPKRNQSTDVSEELKANAELLVNTLKSFGVQTRVVDISRGPTVTRYELQPSAGVKISRITGLSDDIALNLASAGVRIEAPIPNKAAVGIEVPNRITDIVTMHEIINSSEFRGAKSKVSVALGKDISGKEIVFDIAKMPHMLIAGATGSGKSVCINALIMSIMYKATPDEVRLLMIDPKVVELGIYNGIPHLLVPVVTDPRKAAGALGWAVTEMLNRYKLFADNQVRDLTGYNELAKKNEELAPLPQIVIIIDELADLMMAAPNEVEDAICRLAQMARAAGMHLVIATQRPSVDVITGVIKANIPSRIAFSVSSQVDSRTIIDSAGAEKLLGRGDMLFYPVGMPKPTRLQCSFVSDKEVEAVVDFIKNSANADYDDKIMDEIERQAVQEKSKGKEKSEDVDGEDELLPKAIEAVIEASQASTSYLQRKLKVGYARAARIIDEMEAKGIVGPFEGSKPRQVLITRTQWQEMVLSNSAKEESVEESDVT